MALALGVRHQVVVGSGVWGWAAVVGGFAAWFALLTVANTRLRQLRPARPRALSGRLAWTVGLGVWLLVSAGLALLLAETWD